MPINIKIISYKLEKCVRIFTLFKPIYLYCSDLPVGRDLTVDHFQQKENIFHIFDYRQTEGKILIFSYTKLKDHNLAREKFMRDLW